MLTGSARVAQEAREAAAELAAHQERDARRRELERRRKTLESQITALQTECESLQDEADTLVREEEHCDERRARERATMAHSRQAERPAIDGNGR